MRRNTDLDPKIEAMAWYKAADRGALEGQKDIGPALCSIAASLIRIGDLLEKQSDEAESRAEAEFNRSLYTPSEGKP